MSWKAEIYTGGEWSELRAVFATKKEAKQYGRYARGQNIFIQDVRLVKSCENPNYRMVDGFVEKIN